MNSSVPRARHVQRTSVPATGRGATLTAAADGQMWRQSWTGRHRARVSVQGGAGAHSRAPRGDSLPHTGAQGKGERQGPAITRTASCYSLAAAREMNTRSDTSRERTCGIQHCVYQSSSWNVSKYIYPITLNIYNTKSTQKLLKH